MRGSILSILPLLFATSLSGQTPSLEPGMPLRAHAYGTTLSGELVRWDADSLVIRSEGASQSATRAERAIAVSDLLRLDRETPRTRGRGAARGALWGVAIGGAVGLLAGAAQETNCFLCPDSHTEGAMYGGAILGGLGAGIGTVVGALAPGTRSEPVWPPSAVEGS
jgi:hypothetical protein